MKPLRFHRDAQDEYLDSIAWYEGQQPGLGAKLREAVNAALAEVQDHPQRWPLVPDLPKRLRIRRRLVDGFPYAVVYVVLLAEVRVLAIAHGRRRPGYWRARR